MIIGGNYLKLCLIGALAHTLSNDVRACALEVSHCPIKGDVVWVPPHSACRHCIETAQLAISDGALLFRSARRSRAPQVIGSVALTSLGASLCPERLTSLQHVRRRDARKIIKVIICDNK